MRTSGAFSVGIYPAGVLLLAAPVAAGSAEAATVAGGG